MNNASPIKLTALVPAELPHWQTLALGPRSRLRVHPPRRPAQTPLLTDPPTPSTRDAENTGHLPQDQQAQAPPWLPEPVSKIKLPGGDAC
jgi:hypothetical protein